MSVETLISAQRELWNDTIAIYLAERRDSALFVARTPELVEVPDGHYSQPFLRLELRYAQRLMDEMWNCGLRPSEGTGSAGSLKATQNHLTDMQRIAFMLLEKEQPHDPWIAIRQRKK